MAYIHMTKDFSQVRKPLPGIGLEKRQLLAGAVCLAVGVPVFVLLRFVLQLSPTICAFGFALSAAPFGFAILFKKDNLGMEKWARFFYEAHFVRNSERPYETRNMYEVMLDTLRFNKEVEKIVFKGKTKEEIKEIKDRGEYSEITFGHGKDKKKIRVPIKGKIDKNVKKELEKAVKKAKIKGEIPTTAQDTIPYDRSYEDGVFLYDNNYYTITVAFDDVTYQLLDNDPKEQLFERWCRLINYFDPDTHIQFNYGKMEMNKELYRKEFMIPPRKDKQNNVRSEYSEMLLHQLSKGTNNLRKERYVTIGIRAKDLKAARLKLEKITKQVENRLKRLGCHPHRMNGYERLELLFRIFHPATSEKLLWNYDLTNGTGLSSKDLIAPSCFSFKYSNDLNATRYFRVGDRVGCVNSLSIFASDMEDRIISDVLSIGSNVWVSIHSEPYNRKEALKLAAGNYTDIQGQIMEYQRKAVNNGYDMDLLPPELQVFKDSAEKLYQDLQRKDEQLFISTITIVQTARTRKELENNVFELEGILSTYSCRLNRLDYRQEQGYVSSLPLGVNQIEIKRSFTTTDMAIFIPFTTNELFSMHGQYYGMNSLSGNVILVDRKDLVNPNGLVFGMPGYGKSFLVKREILDVFLKTDDDRLTIDPEGEYGNLITILGGQVVKVSLNSNVYINPLEIDITSKNEEDTEYDPIASKINFVASMCELILGENGKLGKDELACIDIACKNIYYKFMEDPRPENMPIISDLDEALRALPDEMGKIGRVLSIALSRYTQGSLSYFNHRSSIDINARLVCFDLKQMDSNQRDLTMLIIQDLIWTRVAKNRTMGKRTWVDIDEFHLLLRSPTTAAYSVEIWKRFRKWGGIPTGITQNIKDLFRSAEIQNILDTTNFIAMLNQAGDDASLLAEHLDLSVDEQTYIKTGERGKGLLWVEGSAVPFEDEFPKNTLSYKVMTTKPEEMLPQGSVGKKKKKRVIA